MYENISKYPEKKFLKKKTPQNIIGAALMASAICFFCIASISCPKGSIRLPNLIHIGYCAYASLTVATSPPSIDPTPGARPGVARFHFGLAVSAAIPFPALLGWNFSQFGSPREFFPLPIASIFSRISALNPLLADK